MWFEKYTSATLLGYFPKKTPEKRYKNTLFFLQKKAVTEILFQIYQQKYLSYSPSGKRVFFYRFTYKKLPFEYVKISFCTKICRKVLQKVIKRLLLR